MNYITGHEFYEMTIGKKIDVDGAYGNQCVDLWNYYNKIVNDGVYINCKPSGYAHSLWENRAKNGALNYFNEVPLNALQDGDWCIFGKNSQTPASHVAMFRVNNGNGTAVFLGQNQDGKLGAVNQQNFKLSGLIGAFRTKANKDKIAYNGHVENLGWTNPVADGGTCGTVGQSKRLEAIHIDTRLSNLDMNAKAHIQNEGWHDYGKINNETVIGTVGKAEALECLCLNCTNANLEYRVHIKDNGWTPWTKADGISTLGTVGQALQLEAIEMKIK